VCRVFEPVPQLLRNVRFGNGKPLESRPVQQAITAGEARLGTGGRLVIPAGGPYDSQYLLLIEKQPDGTFTTKRTLPVRFVPLTRGRGAK
jgi:hypothetical protein